MDEGAQTRLALSALMAALARTLGEKDRTFAERFRRHLSEVAEDLPDGPGDNAGVRDVLAQTKNLLGDDDIEADDPAWIVYAKQPDPDLSETVQAAELVPFPSLSAALALWEQLPPYDRENSIVETSSGRQMDATEIRQSLARRKNRKESI